MIALHPRLAGYDYVGAGLAVAVQGFAVCWARDLHGLFLQVIAGCASGKGMRTFAVCQVVF